MGILQGFCTCRVPDHCAHVDWTWDISLAGTAYWVMAFLRRQEGKIFLGWKKLFRLRIASNGLQAYRGARTD
jgi:hypothetical protein